MVSSRGKWGCGTKGRHGGGDRPQCTYFKEWTTLKRTIIQYMAFLTRQTIFQNLKVLTKIL